MQFKPYKKPDGTEELRLKPESAEDCHSIKDCSKCFFDDANESFGDLNEPFGDFLRELGVELFAPSRPNKRLVRQNGEPTNPMPTNIIPLEDLMKGFYDYYNSPEGTLREDQKIGVGSRITMTALPFKVMNGKVVTDPETREIMEELGIIEDIERMIHEEEDEN